MFKTCDRNFRPDIDIEMKMKSDILFKKKEFNATCIFFQKKSLYRENKCYDPAYFVLYWHYYPIFACIMS